MDGPLFLFGARGKIGQAIALRAKVRLFFGFRVRNYATLIKFSGPSVTCPINGTSLIGNATDNGM